MAEARAAAIRQLTKAYDEIAEDEQLAVALGEYERAQEAHAIGLRIVRALQAELDDPQPRETCHCVACLMVQFRKVA